MIRRWWEGLASFLADWWWLVLLIIALIVAAIIFRDTWMSWFAFVPTSQSVI